MKEFPSKCVTFDKASWFVNYDLLSDTTSLVVAGSDGIGVFFLVLRHDHMDEFLEIVKRNEGFNEGIDGCLGECIRFACESRDIVPDRCTVGGWGSKLKIKS